MIAGPELEGKYQILRKIREGGMGAVYEVRHRLLDERRVIKVIHPHLVASPELAERFRREARLASGLRHPNIAFLHDFSVDPDGRAYIVMELIEGLGLDEILRTSGPPPLGLGLEIARQALRAVGFLHRRGFLHRDVSPDNLMLTRDPEGGPLVKLIDLGIAKVLMEKESSGGITLAGTFLGKPRYAAPEQLGGGADPVDGRSDLYSLGVVIYELLTGVCPIQGDNPSVLLASHLFHPPVDFAVSDPQGKLPEDLRELLRKALAKRPEDRFADAEEMRDRLGEVQERYPRTPGDLDAALARPQDLDATAVLPRRGSTQNRLDRQFLPHTTPQEAVPAVAVLPDLPAPVHGPRVEEPRRKRRAAVWIGAAVVMLALLTALFLGREERTAREPAGPAPPSATASEPEAPAPKPRPAAPAEAEPVAETPPKQEPAKPSPPKPAPPRERSARQPQPAPRAAPPQKPRPPRQKTEIADEVIAFVEPPRPISVPEAPYPPAAATSGAKARVVVSIQVNDKGLVTGVRVLSMAVEEGPGDPKGEELKTLFRDAALAAARRARFAPATSDGVPVSYRGKLTFDF